MATTDNKLYFYESDLSSGALLFKEDNRPPQDKGYMIGAVPSQLFWDGDRIYMATKRAYAIINKLDGNIMYKFEVDSKGKSDYLRTGRHPNDECVQGQVPCGAQPRQEGLVHRSHKGQRAPAVPLI